MEQKTQKLDVCKKNGIATQWTENMYKCAEKGHCANKRDFGGQKYCTPETIMKSDKNEKQRGHDGC